MHEGTCVNNSKIYRVGIYLRLSDEDKNKLNKDDDSQSIKNQRTLLITEIAKNPNYVLTDEYCDEDLSGAGTYRPEFERLIKDCESGKLDVILCKSQSRFSRDMEVIEKYLHNKFIEWNVRFLSFSDNADTFNKGNKKSRQINGLVNEWFLEDVSNNIRTAFHAKMKNGEFISPFASFGYFVSKENTDVLQVDPYASKIVNEIFKVYLEGNGYGKIAKSLNEKGVPSPSVYKNQNGVKLNVISNRDISDIKWSSNAIKTILSNEVYIGNLIQGKRSTVSYKNKKIVKKDESEWIRVFNTHEPIIDKDLFEKAQIQMKERTRVSSKTKELHIFSGKVFCNECKCYLKRNCTSKHEYLVCTSNRDGYNDCINKLSMRYDVLSELVLKAINEKITKYYDEEILNENNVNNKKKKKNSVINQLMKRKKELEKKLKDNKLYLKEIYTDKIKKVITQKQFEELMEGFQIEGSNLENEFSNIIEEINIEELKEKNKKNIKEIFSNYKVLTELNRTIVDEFIDKIYIGAVDNETKTRDILITWNFD
ncbi:MAG: recombinase family protein [bacterium]